MIKMPLILGNVAIQMTKRSNIICLMNFISQVSNFKICRLILVLHGTNGAWIITIQSKIEIWYLIWTFPRLWRICTCCSLIKICQIWCYKWSKNVCLILSWSKINISSTNKMTAHCVDSNAIKSNLNAQNANKSINSFPKYSPIRSLLAKRKYLMSWEVFSKIFFLIWTSLVIYVNLKIKMAYISLNSKFKMLIIQTSHLNWSMVTQCKNLNLKLTTTPVNLKLCAKESIWMN